MVTMLGCISEGLTNKELPARRRVDTRINNRYALPFVTSAELFDVKLFAGHFDQEYGNIRVRRRANVELRLVRQSANRRISRLVSIRERDNRNRELLSNKDAIV